MQLLDGRREVRGGIGSDGDEWADRLVTLSDPALAYEAVNRALVALRGGQTGVQLTGRFAAEMALRPASDFSRFVRTAVLGCGLGLRLLLAASVAREPGARTRLARLAAAGAQIRLSAGPLPDQTLVGTDLAVVYTVGQDGQTQVLVAHREAANALHQFQMALWGQGSELMRLGRDVRPVQLDAAQLQALRMLGAGMKDDTAARQMNVSVRTYRRHVAAILKTMGVDTRFEAGLKAAELGLLSPR
ncbi:response regulator transcription factor [Streptomyces sp. NPDC052301]|uniref:response regulator transcription factor n=1 Tax=Streptomyces sp. NPDC052301 TaxID=3365687 RepID=UPI0037D1F5EF